MLPLELAADWDNVGLLLEAKKDASIRRVLLCVDLTKSVVEEAIENKVNLIISYHPILLGLFNRFACHPLRIEMCYCSYKKK